MRGDKAGDIGSGSPARGRARHAALLIACIYVAVGCTWIFTSDLVVEYISSGTGFAPNRITHFQTIKGVGFITLTGVMVFLLVRHYLKAMEHDRVEMQGRLEGIAEQYERLFTRNPSAMLIF